MPLREGSLCTGYNGLGLSLGMTAAAELAFVADSDPAAAAVLAHRYPDAPNLGDITKVDWGSVPGADIVTAGYPCQPFSVAGRRKGSADVRHLWPAIVSAVRHLRPSYVLMENVTGHLSLGFGRVLADLAALRYVGSWCCVRAADVGAPHRRDRVFILAQLADADRIELRPQPLAFPRGGGAALAGNPREAVGRLDPTPAFAAGAMPQWGIYHRAIERWQHVTGRSAPSPTEPSPRLKGRLAAEWVEWLMGLPSGWVTAVPGISRRDQLRLLGNGVVPQQAAAAITCLVGGGR